MKMGTGASVCAAIPHRASARKCEFAGLAPVSVASKMRARHQGRYELG